MTRKRRHAIGLAVAAGSVGTTTVGTSLGPDSIAFVWHENTGAVSLEFPVEFALAFFRPCGEHGIWEYTRFLAEANAVVTEYDEPLLKTLTCPSRDEYPTSEAEEDEGNKPGDFVERHVRVLPGTADDESKDGHGAPQYAT